MYRIFFKRIFDFVLAAIGLFLLLPLLVILTIALTIVNNGSPFFFQRRPGKDNRIFTIAKFKTMTDATDEKGELLPDFERMTKIGSFIRKTSLDEIPQLWSVLKGDMSLIGPRPLLVKYLPLYSEEQSKRHHVRPGITGWAQVNGRNNLAWERKFELDLFYVNNLSFLLDMKILLKTIAKVFKSEGVNSEENNTMPEFTGTKQ